MLLKKVVILLILSSGNALPSCTFYADDNTDLICLPNDKDTDIVLSGGIVPNNGHSRSITMKNCKLSSVECRTFQNVPDLRSLDISGNSLSVLMPCVLDGLQQLTHLNLSYNKIQELRIGFCDTAKNIKVLDFKGNQIRTIQSGFFDQLSSLKDLYLSNNALKSEELDKRLFQHNSQLKSVDFSRNDMSKATEDLLIELPALETLKLDRCFLSEVPAFARKPNLRTLKVLVLSTNQINTLNDPTLFINLDDLEILNLAGNAIESIAENVFAPLRKLKTIVLKHNKLTQLPEKLFQNMPKLVSVDIAYNDIKKIEVSPFRNTPMKNLNISGNKLTYLPENFGQQLRDAGGRLTKFLFTPNPWQCACLTEIMEEVMRLGLVYNRSRYDGKTGVCKDLGNSFSCVRN